MKFVPTFYVQRSGGRWEILVADSDQNNRCKVIATSHEKTDAIWKAKKSYFGRRGGSVKIVKVI